MVEFGPSGFRFPQNKQVEFGPSGFRFPQLKGRVWTLWVQIPVIRKVEFGSYRFRFPRLRVELGPPDLIPHGSDVPCSSHQFAEELPAHHGNRS